MTWWSHKKNKRKKISAWSVTGLLLSIQFLVLLFPRPAYAFPVSVVGSVPDTTKQITDSIENSILQGLMSSLVNMAAYFMRTLAYDTASYIANGGKGQGALIFEDPGKYFQKVGQDSVGEAIDSLGKSFGVNLCQPPDLKLQASLKIGLDRVYNAPSAASDALKGAGGTSTAGSQSSCSWQQLKSNWSDGIDVSVDINAAADFASEVNVMETDFGYALGAVQQLDTLKKTQEKAGEIETLLGNGFKSVTDLVSGHVNTPAQQIQKEADTLTSNYQGKLSSEQIAGIYASGLWQVIPSAASVFLNTLTSQLLNRLFTDGLVPSEKERGGIADFYAINSVISQRQVAERAFSFLKAKTGTKDSTYDILAQFSICPENPGLNNCVMNQDMKSAIDLALIGKPMTLYEAVFGNNAFISPNTPLVSPRRTADNEDTDCYKDKLCYSNIQKMRKARILPLGMEIAALKSDPDNPWTLGEVLLGFEDCPTAELDGSYQVDITNHPFCHLVNPNWILRAPDTQCENKVYSPELLVNNSPQRREECADVSTCLTEDENGNCVDDKFYGYCTQEKNVWYFPGDTCEPEFASCKTYTNQETSTVVSYLSRTLEYGSCNAAAVGCQPYVTEKAAGTDEWQDSQDDTIVGNKIYGAQQTLYLNDRITTRENVCPDGADGCTAFIGAEVNPTTGAYIKDAAKSYIQDDTRQRNLKKAPNYLGCYDVNFTSDSPEIDYPTTQLDIAQLTDDPRCDAYASVCLPEEVGCEAYTPVGGGETVPGVVGDNFCPAACVGYDTFRQEETNFEAAEYPLYFIPDNGDSCSAQYVGCDEFTNIGDVTAGGEQLEYYTYIKQCEPPTGDNSSVYYSWEGSESTGFVLRVHTLAKVGSDYEFIPSGLQSDFAPESPAYADDSLTNLTENDGLCNETLYNNLINGDRDAEVADPDCRALYDADGNVYYRLLAETVTVSSACHPLRKTESRLVDASNSIGDAASCTRRGGYWDGGSCQVCAGGGTWQQEGTDATNGSCIYYAIDAPGESVSCPASANACRAYTGNAGNNVRPVFETDTFEPAGEDADSLALAKEAWGPEEQVSIAAESLQVNFNSLRINGGTGANVITRDLSAGSVESGESYELTFWARGIAQILSISLRQGDERWSLTTDPLTNVNLPISISQTWRQYTVGPVLFTGDEDAALELVFDRSSSDNIGVYFLDNVSLTRTSGKKSLIRDSWQTAEGYDAPSVCFADNQNPNGPLPGAALGCAEYKTSRGQTVYATGFERLCREKAVGCAPLWDTYNSDATYAEVYNGRCINGTISGNGIEPTIVSSATECIVTVDSSEYTCSILAGESSCAIADAIRIPSEDFLDGPFGQKENYRIKETAVELLAAGESGMFVILDSSSVYVPADTALESPIFLTDSPAYACKDDYLGCQVTGLEEQGAISNSYTDQGVINLPANYLGEQGILCTQEQVACSAFTTTDGSTSYFKDPTVNADKLCVYQAPQLNDPEAPTGWFLKTVGHCSQDNSIECDSNVVCGTGNSCIDIGEVKPCYPNYQENFDSFGLWSNGSPQYTGAVGECPSTQNLCTELVDPYDTDTSGKNQDGTSYYVIFDDALINTADDCNGQASLREGCVLFDNTEVPTKSYDTTETYKASEAQATKNNGTNSLVIPVSGQNDANVLLKVDRNRECSEWLACASYQPIETAAGKQIYACESFGRCTAFAADGSCAKWASEEDAPFLDIDTYISRDTSWNGTEYTGYSLYNRYSIADLNTITFDQIAEVENSSVDTENSYLGYKLGDCNQSNGSSCGADGVGRCIEGGCYVPLDGAFDSNDVDLARIAYALGQAECKVPPEQDSPYSFDIIETINDRDMHGFASGTIDTPLVRYTFSSKPDQSDMNVCQGGDCTCNYVKITYGTSLVKDYWPAVKYHQRSSELNSWGICTGASQTEGDYCREDDDCGYGTCQKINRIDNLIGSTGHCLEYDLSRPQFDENGQKTYACLTWYPSDKSFGRLDNYNLFTEAGYAPYIDAIALDGGAAGKVYCTESFGRSGGSYEGTLKIAPRYTGDPTSKLLIENASSVSMSTGSCSDRKQFGAFFANPEDGVVPLNEDTNPGINDNPGGINCGENITIFDKNPYLWYACGVAQANSARVDCGNSSATYSVSNAMDSLYSFMSLFGWTYLDSNAVVLRVEGHDVDANGQDNNYGYYPSTGTTGEKKIGSLVPDPYDADAGTDNGHDTKTLLHPPRFVDAEESFRAEMTTPSEGDIFVNTMCLVAGGCETYQDITLTRSTETEKYLNLQNLESVYFIPLSIADSADGIVPPLFSTQLKIDFTKEKTMRESALEIADGESIIKTGAKSNADIGITMYTLHRDDGGQVPCQGLVSFCEYDSTEQVVSNYGEMTQDVHYTGYSDAIRLERNKIYTRKVVVYYSYTQSNPASFVQGLKFDGATSHETDPFTSDCGDGDSNFIAIGMDFNKDGEFLGYISRHCHPSPQSHGVQLATIAVMKDQCSEFVTVYRDVDPALESNKAWTNRVWNMSKYVLKNAANTTDVLTQETPRAPFGSASLAHSDIVSAKTVNESQAKLLQYAFNNPIFGYPLYCYPSAIESTYKVFASEKRCQNLLNDNFSQSEINAINSWSSNSNINGEVALSRLFASYYAVATYPFNNLDIHVKKDTQTGFEPYDDYTGLAGTYADYVSDMGLIPPQIYSLNIDTCFSNDISVNCTPAEANNFTVGGQNDGVIISENSYTARASFFAFADDNRMPIRRIMVNWGDGLENITNANTMGFYKNRKPFCEPSNDVGTETTLGYCRNQNTGDLTLLTCKEASDCPTDTLYSCVHVGENKTLAHAGISQTIEDVSLFVGETYTLNVYQALFNDWGNRGQLTFHSQAEDRDIVSVSLPINDPDGILFKYEGKTAGSSVVQVEVIDEQNNHELYTFTVTVAVDPRPENLYDIDAERAGQYDNYEELRIIDSFVQPRFGNLPRACEAAPYEYYHTYGCTTDNQILISDARDEEKIDMQTEQKLFAGGLTENDYICVYQPKVQVLDNWGYCNGSNVDVNGNYISPLMDGVNNSNNSVCDNDTLGIAWAPYKGKIIVIPSI